VFTATLPVLVAEQRCRSKVAGEDSRARVRTGAESFWRMVFEAQLLSRPISGRCRSLRACLARVASLSGLGHARTAEFRHAQAAVRGDPIGAPGRWVAAFSCAVQGCSAAACGLPAGDGTWAGCCICMLGKRRRFHEARQQRTSCGLCLCCTVAFACQSTPPAASRLPQTGRGLASSPYLGPDPVMDVRVDLPT
jgi:hypothetical protein